MFTEYTTLICQFSYILKLNTLSKLVIMVAIISIHHATIATHYKQVRTELHIH